MSDGFILYASFLDAIEDLPEEEQGKALLAICRYGIRGEEPSNGGVVSAMFKMAKPQIDANRKRRENGKLGGRKANSETETEPMVQKNETIPEPSVQKTETTLTQNDVKTETETEPKVKVKVKEKVKVKDINNMSDKALEDEFDSEIWNLYPATRRNGKKEARAAYVRDRKKGASKTDVIFGINRYKAYIKTCEVEDRFVKQADTFFRQRSWENEWRPLKEGGNKWSHGMEEHDYDWDGLEKDMFGGVDAS